ncbi:MAG: response regulator [Desulfuromonadaceae bacterium]|nr:response regulator [Desulfuromonadaceae bacterium]MDD5104136.1 response regulator [Desulfuromonadaceae bacterium]
MDERLKVLVVDDEPINVAVIESALEEEYDVITAQNGFEAINLTGKQKPDLILLDVMMPELNGFDVCKIIKADTSFADIPVIFLTALNTRESESQALETGGIDYLIKPVNLELLKLKVHNHLELKKRNDLIREQRNLLARQKDELEATFARVKRLEGIIPICMYCKSIRSDSDSWQKLEDYISEHSDAFFSHGMCPDCFEEHYGSLDREAQQK